MTWLIHERMNYSSSEGLVLAGTPFEVSEKSEIERLKSKRGFEQITAKAAKALLSGEPANDDENDDEKGDD